jgi:hypothetical protein
MKVHRSVRAAIGFVSPYLAWTFITADPLDAFSSPDARMFLLFFTVWMTALAFVIGDD